MPAMPTAQEFNEFNRGVVDEFRQRGGEVGGRFAGAPMILVNHVGAKSGTTYTAPLVYTNDGDSFVVIASKGGSPEHPQWFHNLVANPDVTVEVGTETIPCGPEWPRATSEPGSSGRRPTGCPTSISTPPARSGRSRSSCSTAADGRRSLRIVVIGPGAVGGTIAVRLADSGLDVEVVARGPHLAAIQRDGLELRDPGGSRVARVRAVGRPDEVEWGDDHVVLLAVKSQDTPGVLAQLADVAPVELPVVCVQNGVTNELDALRLFSNVHGVVVMCPTVHLRPGVVIAHSHPIPGILDVGRFPAGHDDTTLAVAAALRRAGFESQRHRRSAALAVGQVGDQPRQRGGGRLRPGGAAPDRSVSWSRTRATPCSAQQGSTTRHQKRTVAGAATCSPCTPWGASGGPVDRRGRASPAAWPPRPTC